MLTEIELLWSGDYPFGDVAIVHAVPEHWVLLEVPGVADVVTRVGHAALVDDEGVEFVFSEDGVLQGVAEVDAEFEVEGEEDLLALAVGVLEDGEGEDDEIREAEGFEGCEGVCSCVAFYALESVLVCKSFGAEVVLNEF